MPGSIDTPRLRLVPYSPRDLLALAESAERFKAVSGLRPAPGLRDFLISPDVAASYLEALRTARAADVWVHGFAVVHRESGSVIGNGAFKGPPDPSGMVEIAYGIVPEFQNRGYATEVAAALLEFACKEERVALIRAHTLPLANASTRVLTKCGFTHVGEVIDPEDGRIWRWECDPTRASPLFP